MKIIANLTQINTFWTVYKLTDINNTVLYIGVAKLSEIYKINEARKNSEFIRLVNHNSLIGIEITHIGDEKFCRNEAFRQVWDIKPVCNVKGKASHGYRTAIECVETGETFPTISAAANSHGVAQSNISSHLAGKTGYRSVAGKTYKRVDKS